MLLELQQSLDKALLKEDSSQGSTPHKMQRGTERQNMLEKIQETNATIMSVQRKGDMG